MITLVLLALIAFLASSVTAQNTTVPILDCIEFPFTSYDAGLLACVCIGAFLFLFFTIALIVACCTAGTRSDGYVRDDDDGHPKTPWLCGCFCLFWMCVGIAMFFAGGYYLYYARIYSGDCDSLTWVEATRPIPALALTTPVNLTIAFVGDSGGTSDTWSVYSLIKDESEFLVHVGDFDYCDSPSGWKQQIDATMGPDFPIIAVTGNHDLHAWSDYSKILELYQDGSVPGLVCEGYLGVNYWCVYKGIFFAFSSVGSRCAGYRNYAYHEEQLRNLIDQSTNSSDFPGTLPLPICAWHKNQAVFQTGAKADETGFGVHAICQEAGAPIFTGHDHAYARTFLLSDPSQQTVSQNCQFVNDTTCVYNMNNGTIVALVGLGGQEISHQHQDLISHPWWASTFDETFGALFCKFNFNGDLRKTYCYFKTIDGRITDEFMMYR